MNYYYNPRVKTIKDVRKESKEINLTYLESRLIEALLDNELNTWEEISIHVYGYYAKCCLDGLRRTKFRLLQKIKLNIVTICGIRY